MPCVSVTSHYTEGAFPHRLYNTLYTLQSYLQETTGPIPVSESTVKHAVTKATIVV